MNRTILIVICDFLLVSLLAFSTVDINKVADQTGARAMNLDTAAVAPTNHVGGRQDLGDVMRLALEEERKKQEALAAELSMTRTNYEQQLHSREQELRAREQQAEKLQTQEAGLQRQMSAAQTNIESLNQQLHASSVETLITREQRAAQEAEVRKQMEKADALKQQLAALQQSNQLVTAQRAQLQGQLQLAQAEKQAAAAQLTQAQEDLNAQRQQNAKLAEGVKALSTKSSELAQEIRENRPLAPNLIFSQFATNRVNISFFGVRPGFFGGDATRSKETETILATDGTNTYALCHLQDTLLALGDPGTAWEEMTGSISRGAYVFPVNSLSFYLLDPRVAFMPVSASQAGELGGKVYRISSDPYKFQDAVVVGARDGYYGECKFQIDLTTPQYLKMDHNSLKGLFGKFNPSTGDLVFSKTGELMGVMANNTYCIIIRNFLGVETVRFGPNTRDQPIAETLSALYATVTELPFKLQ